MVTLVGIQSNFVNAIKDLLELEYDAVETYTTAIKKLQNIENKQMLTNFRADHERHIKELVAWLKLHKEEVPTSDPSGKSVIAKIALELANTFGSDGEILNEIISAENDTNTAYERINDHSDKADDISQVLKHALEDERRHRKSIQEVIDKK